MEVSRRTFLKGAAVGAVGIAAIGSVGMLEGCSSSAKAEDKYAASAKGCHGDVTVTAVISKGKITSLTAEGPLETPNVGGLALKSLPGKIVEKNSLAVDAIAGATMTSTAIITATAYCMTKAGAAVKVGPVAQNYKAGTYSAKYKGHVGPVPVSVTFSASKIEKIELGKNDETPHLIAAASKLIGDQIIADQSLAVDAVTTATYSARAILSGVEDCVKQAGGKPEELKHPVLSNPAPGKDEEDSADIVIVGAGTSGSVALYRAASSGKKVICVESTPVVGGMGEISGFASMRWYGSKLQKQALALTDEYVAAQIKADVAAMTKIVTYDVDARMLQACATQCGPMVDMLADAGMKMTARSDAGVVIPAKGLRFQVLHEAAAKLGAKTLRSHRVDKVLVDDKGKIQGVVATRPDGGHLTIKAKAVVLAAGGACANQEMMLKYFPDYAETVENCAISSDDGAALSAAWSAGAVPGMFGVHAHNHTLPLTAKYAGVSTVEATDDISTVGNIPLLWLDRHGKRWANEENAYSPTPGGNAVLFAKRGFNVLDQATVDAFVKTGTTVRAWRGKAVNTPLADLVKQLADGEKTGFVFKADAIEQLAAKTGWDPKVAKSEIDRYNAIVDAQVDGDYFKSAASLKYKITTGPFYAVEIRPRCLGSFGGLVLAADYAVLKEDGSPLPGLFAAGDMACGWFGKTYPDIGGLTSFHNTVSGYVAAGSAVAYVG